VIGKTLPVAGGISIAPADIPQTVQASNPSTGIKPISRGSAGFEMSKTRNPAVKVFSRLVNVSVIEALK